MASGTKSMRTGGAGVIGNATLMIQAELVRFNAKYRTILGQEISPDPEMREIISDMCTPGCEELRAEGWDGLEIAPYLHRMRLSSFSWYYTWDCASGCIWNASRVSIKLLNYIKEAK
jgi:hypothetical protein